MNADVVEPDLFGEIHHKPSPRTAPTAPAVAAPVRPVQLEAFPVGADQHAGQGVIIDATGTDAALGEVLYVPPPSVPCSDCGRPLRAAASRRRGRGGGCDRKRRATQTARALLTDSMLP